MITIVIPVYNEADSLLELYAEIDQVLNTTSLIAQIIFIDDGSTDSTWKIIEQLVDRDKRVYGLKFRRNFGKAIALNEGFSIAQGDYIISIDADLQDDPQEIPNLLSLLRGPFDMVSGWKRCRHDPWHKVFPSMVFNRMVGLITGLRLHDHNCGLKAYRAEVVREIILYGEMHRFITVLAYFRGFRVGEVEVNHRPRKYGESKYGSSRFVKGFLDLLTVRFITSFGERPLHLFGSFGIGFVLIGLGSLGYLAMLWALGFTPIGNRPLLFYGIASLLLGGNLITFGVLAELLIWRFLQRESRHGPISPVVKQVGQQ